MVRRICVLLLFYSVLLIPPQAEAFIQERDTSSVTGQEEVLEEEAESSQVQETEAESRSDLVLFFGRFHPFFVHLPIGFLLFAVLLEGASILKRFEQLTHAVPFALFMGILSGLAAGITGYMLSLGGGYDDELIGSHKWLGIGVVVLSSAAFFIRITRYDHPVFKKVFRFILVVLTGIVVATGHFGGSLTHGSDYLFRYMPQPLLSWTGAELEEEEEIALIEDLDSARVYDDIIQPIIRTRCEKCHNNDRTEGELLLTSMDHIMTGGENGSVIEKNHADSSELYKRLLLPPRHDDRMPPRGRRQLTHDQIKLIAWWIDQGVPSSEMVSELDISEEISDILLKLTVDGQSFFDITEVPPAKDSTLEEAEKIGFRITPIAEGMNFLLVRVSKSRPDISAEDMELLLPLSEQITWLDLGRLSVTDKDLLKISEFKHLTRLNLQHTDISDSTLELVSRLEYLEYLNIYATDVSDEGLKSVASLTNLKSLYLWQTDVSNEAIEELKEKLPQLNVNTGL